MNETKTAEQLDEAYRIAVHELGHCSVCAAFGIPSSPKVFERAERYLDSDGKIIVGVCETDALAGVRPFEKSCIGWGGYLAEHICGVAFKSCRNPFPLRRETLRDFYNAALVGFEENFTRADQIWICSYPDKLRSFKSAYQRLRLKAGKIKRLAPDIAANANGGDRAARTIAALRDCFRRHNGATHDDFVRLVCGNDAERFEQFISRKATDHLSNRTMDFAETKKSLTNSFLANLTDEIRARHKGRTDPEIAGVLFDENFASSLKFQWQIYGGDFKDEATWLAAARDFMDWTPSENK